MINKKNYIMKLPYILRNFILTMVFGTFTLISNASTIWTTWLVSTPGNPGNVVGTLGDSIVIYNGQVGNWNYNNSNNSWVGGLGNNIWVPASTYIGGVVTDAPTQNGIIMTGPEPEFDNGTNNAGAAVSETISFSSPITNPVMALWSLGENLSGAPCVGNPLPTGCIPAMFNFTTPFIFEAGGGDQYFDGTSILTCTDPTVMICTSNIGSVAYGIEGSGSIMFPGTYSTITFTTPDQEWYYGFSIGEQTPEPETFSLLGLGLLVLALIRTLFIQQDKICQY